MGRAEPQRHFRAYAFVLLCVKSASLLFLDAGLYVSRVGSLEIQRPSEKNKDKQLFAVMM
jgi:hypothetical protein